MDPSTERDLGTGSASAEKEDVSTQQQISQSEHSTNQPTGDSLNEKSLPADTSSTLSVSAEPFKSTSFDQSSTMLSALAKEFVPKATPTPVYTESYQAYGETEYVEQGADPTAERSDPLLDYAFQVLYDITYSPGHYTRLCDQLVSNLTSWPALDASTLQILVDEIVALAIREPNFRYNGARLCNSIARGLHFPPGPNSPDFRGTLFNSCKVIHDERKTLMQSDAEYLRGFALFMSELFVHMNQKDASTRFRVLGRAVRELLLTFLEHPTPGNVKCVCQILKLSGSYIEDDDRETHNGKPVEMDQLMTKIDTVRATVDMQMHMKDLLSNMIELRSSDWGRAPTSPVARDNQTMNQHLNSQMGVYYGPDGQALTAEETEFLDQGINRHEEEDEYEFHYEEDTGMDDEMAEAFEKFLMMQDTLK